MSSGIGVTLLAAGIFFGMLLLIEVGRRIGAKHYDADPKRFRAGLGSVEGAVFALLGLLVAFTFSGAADRFEDRRKLIVAEANAIDVAYLRLDLLDPPDRDLLRADFRSYLDSRLAFYRVIQDEPLAMKRLAESERIQKAIWTRAVSAARAAKDTGPTVVLLPALNAMIDITTARTAVLRFHPPEVVYAMLVALALLCALLAGFGMAGRTRASVIHVIGFPFIFAVTVCVILDLEHPRAGFIRVDTTDQWLIRLRESM